MKKMSRHIKAVGFDFDGTLVLSEEKKAQEMAKVFREKFGVQRGVPTAYRKLAGTGKNRQEKVTLLFQQFLGRKPTRQELRAVDEHFGFHYEQSLHRCPLMQCTNVLGELKKQVKFLFLLSLENKREVRRIAEHCGLGTYFDEVLGGPKAKQENLLHVLKKHHLKPQEVLYVGDSAGDIQAAKRTGMKVVILQKNFRYRELLRKLGADFVFRSLCELPRKVEEFERNRYT